MVIYMMVLETQQSFCLCWLTDLKSLCCQQEYFCLTAHFSCDAKHQRRPTSSVREGVQLYLVFLLEKVVYIEEENEDEFSSS